MAGSPRITESQEKGLARMATARMWRPCNLRVPYSTVALVVKKGWAVRIHAMGMFRLTPGGRELVTAHPEWRRHLRENDVHNGGLDPWQ